VQDVVRDIYSGRREYGVCMTLTMRNRLHNERSLTYRQSIPCAGWIRLAQKALKSLLLCRPLRVSLLKAASNRVVHSDQ